jgi:hypothetical protein
MGGERHWRETPLPHSLLSIAHKADFLLSKVKRRADLQRKMCASSSSRITLTVSAGAAIRQITASSITTTSNKHAARQTA